MGEMRATTTAAAARMSATAAGYGARRATAGGGSALTRELRREVAEAVREAVREALEGAQEVWLTKEQLVAQFGMFTPSWLRVYGHLLPRTRAIVTGADGVAHKTGCAYPRNKIQRMIADGSIKEL